MSYNYYYYKKYKHLYKHYLAGSQHPKTNRGGIDRIISHFGFSRNQARRTLTKITNEQGSSSEMTGNIPDRIIKSLMILLRIRNFSKDLTLATANGQFYDDQCQIIKQFVSQHEIMVDNRATINGHPRGVWGYGSEGYIFKAIS